VNLTPGTRLGPYEVIAQIGVGGMGEVYQAIDTNLKRQVAIKVLPASVAGEPDRLARFQREAEVLASLNHPNIATVYGIEHGALVMELVEGSDLKGTWKTQFGEAPLEKGKIDGKKISFSISFNDTTINSTGEIINENEILIKNERGEMKLTRVKP